MSSTDNSSSNDRNAAGPFGNVPFDPVGLVEIGRGFHSVVYRSRDGWTVKRAVRPDSLERLQREGAVLAGLEADFPAPQGYRVLRPAAALPFGGACHRHVAGRVAAVLKPLSLATLGQLLARLHRSTPTWPTIPMRAIPWRRIEAHFPSTALRRGQALLERYAESNIDARPVHGDVWPENVVVRAADDVTLVDWADARRADIAIDFASLAYLPGAVAEVARAYRQHGGNLGAGFEARLLACRLLRELSGLQFALNYPDSGELADAVAKVTRLLDVLQR